MALKKSELYSCLWASCDELRGGMDASQYKDYLLILLFVKYVSDRYAGQPYAAITIPKGASFADMVALKGKPDIGDQINKKILGPLAQANRLAEMPDFNDATKLGSGKELVERLTNLIAIFENPALDFSKNRAEGDDLLGDAYEYLMRHFATESGKSKGQFYTPAEVSRHTSARRKRGFYKLALDRRQHLQGMAQEVALLADPSNASCRPLPALACAGVSA
jgi:type I restriction enzyme M protein